MITKKIPVNKIGEGPVNETVANALRNDPKNAYTIMGLMVEKFGVREAAIASKPFNQWDKGMPNLYTKIKSALEGLVKEGKAKKQKVSKAMVYWWVGN